jgi:hypothetical protein
MATVFTRKVLISGDNIKDYLQVMEKAEKEKAPFREMLDELNQEFEAYLTEQFSVRTARKHSCKVALFVDFLCWNSDVKSIDEITRGIATTFACAELTLPPINLTHENHTRHPTRIPRI